MALLARLPPPVRAGLTSCAVMSAGDVICQAIQRRAAKGQAAPHDWDRTARFGLIGLTLHGPYFLYGFRYIDQRFGPSTTLLTAAKKTAFGQVTMFPAYVAAFFTAVALLESGGQLGAVGEKLRSSYVQTVAAGTLFWPVANMVNFTMVPPEGRVLYVNAAGLVWNAFLSYVNSRAPAVAAHGVSGGIAPQVAGGVCSGPGAVQPAAAEAVAAEPGGEVRRRP